MELRINRILAMLLDKDNAQEANTAASQLITELQKNYRYGDVAFIENKEDKDEKCVRFLCLLVDKEREIEMLKAQKLHLLNRSAQEEPKRPSRTKYQRLTRTKPVTAEDIAALCPHSREEVVTKLITLRFLYSPDLEAPLRRRGYHDGDDGLIMTPSELERYGREIWGADWKRRCKMFFSIGGNISKYYRANSTRPADPVPYWMKTVLLLLCELDAQERPTVMKLLKEGKSIIDAACDTANSEELSYHWPS
jgi:hypothetical protein